MKSNQKEPAPISGQLSGEMTAKEKADCLLGLQKIQMEHLQQTRELEFKVNIALWTLIALAGYQLVGKLRLDAILNILIYIIVAAVIYAAHLVLWMMPIQNSCDQDTHYIRDYGAAIEAMVGFKSKKFDPYYVWQDRFRTRGWLWVLGETGLTIALLIALGLMLSMKTTGGHLTSP